MPDRDKHQACYKHLYITFVKSFYNIGPDVNGSAQ